MGKSLSWVERIDAVLRVGGTLWAILVMLGIGSVATWLASISRWLSASGPLAWLAAGVAAAGAVGIVLFVMGSAYLAFARGKHALARSRESVSINPLEDTFQRLRISAQNLAPAIRGMPVVDKTLISCELLGPAVVYFRRSAVLVDTTFIDCDLIPIPDNQPVKNAIVFDRLTLRYCSLYGLTILLPESQVEAARQGVRGVKFMGEPTPPPAGGG